MRLNPQITLKATDGKSTVQDSYVKALELREKPGGLWKDIPTGRKMFLTTIIRNIFPHRN